MQGESEKLERHLEKTAEKLDVAKVLNPSGFTPVHLAAYKGQNRTCEVLINFVLNSDNYKGCPATPQDETENSTNANAKESKKKRKVMQRRNHLRQWLNRHTQGEDSFTALHFASFHGNLNLIRLFIKHGSDVRA